MNKKDLLNELIQQMEREAGILEDAAKEAHRAATHEESRSEDKHDTRGIEASYLAGAQAKRVADMEREIFFLKKLDLRTDTIGKIQNGSLIALLQASKESWVFLLPVGAGREVERDGIRVRVISPQGPLGEALLDGKAGDRVEVEGKDGELEYKIQAVF